MKGFKCKMTKDEAQPGRDHNVATTQMLQACAMPSTHSSNHSEVPPALSARAPGRKRSVFPRIQQARPISGWAASSSPVGGARFSSPCVIPAPL